MSVIVVGGGWAGLAAAVTLAEHRVPVVVLEGAKQLGGRARCAAFANQTVDNGQHLMVGAYTELLRLLNVVGMNHQTAFKRVPLALDIRGLARDRMLLVTPRVPSPLNLMTGLLTAHGLKLRESIRALRFCTSLARNRWEADANISVEALLIHHRQTGRLSRLLWEPLCLAALNTPLRDASAKHFVRVLGDTFGQRKNHSDFLIPRVNLGEIFPEPAMAFVEQHGGSVKLQQKATELTIRDDCIVGLIANDSIKLSAKHVIVATSATACQRLLAPHTLLNETALKLSQLSYEPITTIYLQYPPTVRLGREVIGIAGGLSQWLFDRRVAGQPGLMAVVISASGRHSSMSHSDLADVVAGEIVRLYPRWPAPMQKLVIEEKRATFSCRTGVDEFRPQNQTAVEGLWLAGDFTDTGYPSTLEGAVRSGIKAAQGVLADLEKEALADSAMPHLEARA